jgi:hypothetical protein
MKRLLVVAIAVVATACATPTSKDVQDRWVGKHINEAIATLGPPQQTTPLPGGVTIYTWEQVYGSAMAIRRSTCRTGLHANTDGVIVNASQLSESLLCK